MDKKIARRATLQKEQEELPRTSINVEASRGMKVEDAMKLETKITEIKTTIKQKVANKRANETKLKNLMAKN